MSVCGEQSTDLTTAYVLLGFFIKYYIFTGMWIYVYIFKCVLVIDVHVFVAIPCWFYSYASVVQCKLEGGDSSSSSLIVHDYFSYHVFWGFQYEVKNCAFQVEELGLCCCHGLLPETMLVSLAHAALSSYWCPWPLILLRTMMVSMVHAAAESHVDICGLYCHWKPCWGHDQWGIVLEFEGYYIESVDCFW